MSVQMNRINVFGQPAYPTDPQIIIPFEPKEVSIFNEDDADTVAISFDGVNDHGVLIPRSTLTYNQNGQKVWLRSVGAGSDPITAQVVMEN